MKTLISIMTTNSTWAALRNPAFKKVGIPAEISCTCARRAASMKRALTFYECDAPLVAAASIKRRLAARLERKS